MQIGKKVLTRLPLEQLVLSKSVFEAFMCKFKMGIANKIASGYQLLCQGNTY